MTVTPSLFEAFLKCPTKSWLRRTGEPPSGNTYAEWIQTEHESYCAAAANRLLLSIPSDESAPPGSSRREETHYSTEALKTAKWTLDLDVPVQFELRSSRGNEAQTSSPPLSTITPQPTDQSLLTSAATMVETRLHAVERMPSEGRGKAAQFIPIRFIHRNKLTKDDKLLIAFDALVLSEVLGRPITLGNIIHGEDHPTLKVKASALAGEVKKRLDNLAALLSSPTPPDLVLNRHCGECEFQIRCRKIAVEKDDLSLLANMSAKERQKLRSKGIFTVTQLSYTFRPRRRPKRQRDKREKYHHSLKALAIREKKIHIVGSPELKIEGTPVYLDVEGLPDRDFYYLIGLRIGHGESAVQHSLWADTVADEGKIWREFLAILETVEKPVLIHYGSYEIEFLKQMSKRHEPPLEGSAAMKATVAAINLVSVLFSQIYFPTCSNGLKELGTWLKCTWPGHTASGLESIAHRMEWEYHRNVELRRSLAVYNSCDCIALNIVTMEIQRLFQARVSNHNPSTSSPIHTDDMQSDMPYRFGKVSYALPEFEAINKAAYWDYQQARIRLRTLERSKARQKLRPRSKMQERTFTKTTEASLLSHCPHCKGTKISHGGLERRVVDIQFTRTGLRRNLVRYLYHQYKCHACAATFTDRPEQ